MNSPEYNVEEVRAEMIANFINDVDEKCRAEVEKNGTTKPRYWFDEYARMLFDYYDHLELFGECEQYVRLINWDGDPITDLEIPHECIYLSVFLNDIDMELTKDFLHVIDIENAPSAGADFISL